MNILKILVVEDEYGMRLAIARALRDYIIHLPDIEGEKRDNEVHAQHGKKLGTPENIEIPAPEFHSSEKYSQRRRENTIED